jgi:sugar/nucleoside kinase (ribokinase family)
MADSREDPENPEVLGRIARELGTRNNAAFVVTRGSKGMMVLDRNSLHCVDGVKVSGLIDIVGAGDSASAGFVLGLTRGLTASQAAMVGCCVSSITIQQIGTTGTATVPQVLKRLEAYLQGKTV